jgi:uncharacterized damage-inducible protein DinB
MKLNELLLSELEVESKTTRRVLERIPQDQLGWKPHQKSMSLGQLAQHVAANPGIIANSSLPDSYRVEDFRPDPDPVSVAQVLDVHESSVEGARSVLATLTDERAAASWSMTAQGNTILTMPRIHWIRTYLFNHWYHHRGQLSVYLRELNVPVPAMYGPSADES